MEYKICQKCNKKYEKPYNLSQKGWAKSKYCNPICFRLVHSGWMKGKKFTDEHKKKIRLALTGKKRPNNAGEKHPNWLGGKPKCLNCGKTLSTYNVAYCQPCFHENVPVWNKGRKGKQRNHNIKGLELGRVSGRKLSEEQREKLSLSLKGRCVWNKGKPQPQTAREKNPNWKGGKYKNLRHQVMRQFLYVNWRKAIFERDNYTCQDCGTRGGELHADHRKPYIAIVTENNITTLEQAMGCAELWDISNGRTLCVDCHRQTETYGHKVLNFLIQTT